MSSSSPPPPSPPPLQTTYTHLLTLLHPSPPFILEIDILPSTYPPVIQYEHPALALPKSLLIKLYLHARSIFFHHDGKSSDLSASLPASSDGNGNEQEREEEYGYEATLKATRILLLLEPNHLTASNFLKGHLQLLSLPPPKNNKTPQRSDNGATLRAQLHSSLTFLTTLLTSPLPKHAKASTLWSHRLYLIKTYHHHLLPQPPPSTDTTTPTATVREEEARPQRAGIYNIWTSELSTVLKAAERHPRNYYAWSYARQLFHLLQHISGTDRSNRNSVLIAEQYRTIFLETARKVHEWCSMHPRDISGWAFLVFWLREMRDGRGWGDESRRGEMEGEVERVMWETRAWVRKYEWRGESVEWFLTAATELELAGDSGVSG